MLLVPCQDWLAKSGEKAFLILGKWRGAHSNPQKVGFPRRLPCCWVLSSEWRSGGHGYARAALRMEASPHSLWESEESFQRPWKWEGVQLAAKGAQLGTVLGDFCSDLAAGFAFHTPPPTSRLGPQITPTCGSPGLRRGAVSLSRSWYGTPPLEVC